MKADARRIDRRRGWGDFVTQVILPLFGLGLLGFAGWFVWETRIISRNPPPPIQPASSPFLDSLAAAGVVEAQTENIAVGSATAGVVVEVLVKVGDPVEPGTPLFRLDDRELQGQIAVKRSAVSRSRSELLRQEAEPRKEEIPVRVALVNEARAGVAAAEDAVKRSEETFARKVTTEQDLVEKRELLVAARAALEKTQADLKLLEAGSWEYDRDVTRAQISQAEADVAKTEIDIDRLTVRSLVHGRVLQVNVRPGEFVGAPPGQPLVIVGNVEKLHVRVDIDEFDIPRFKQGADATGFPRGDLQQGYPLSFVRVEPFVVPKKSLTGDNTERVDTRVLQVIYELDPDAPGGENRPRLFVGQQVEVFIRGEATTEAAAAEDAAKSN
jgi:HlyD family secretion protein